MRGTHSPLNAFAVNPGNTPAYAGNTAVLVSFYDVIEEHPRVCGEHCYLLPVSAI